MITDMKGDISNAKQYEQEAGLIIHHSAGKR